METILSVIALAVSLISGGFAVYTFWWTSRRDRKNATLEAYSRLQAEVFDNLNTYTPTEIRDICMDIRSSEYKTISGYIARIEHFCVGINENIYDRNIFYALAHGYFDGNQLRKRITPMLETKNQSNNSKEIYYQNLISVLIWMEEHKNSLRSK